MAELETKTKSAKTTQPKLSGPELAAHMTNEALKEKENTLAGSTVYLSGPMDFVASREEEKKFGWRNRVTDFLRRYKVTIYDPWNKPPVVGLEHYGKEDEFTAKKRDLWSYESTERGDRTRAELCAEFYPTLHIDLRMTDTADFLIAFVPTNIYSVGTVHEIATARLQCKPVLLVTPPVTFPAYDELGEHLKKTDDKAGLELLEKLKQQAPLRENPNAIPSLWYMALVDAHYFFDGFGFAQYMHEFPEWKHGPLDEREKRFPPKRPLLPYLESLNKAGIPPRFDLERDRYVENAEWLIFDDGNL